MCAWFCNVCVRVNVYCSLHHLSKLCAKKSNLVSDTEFELHNGCDKVL